METQKNSFQCTLEAKSTYTAGEPVALLFSLQNLTDRPLYVLKWYTPLEGIFGDIFLIARNGAVIPYQGLMAKRGDPSSDDYVLVKPGATVAAVVDLAQGYDLSQIGHYEVECSSRLYDVTDDRASIPQRQEDHLGQELSCSTVNFEIVP